MGIRLLVSLNVFSNSFLNSAKFIFEKQLHAALNQVVMFMFWSVFERTRTSRRSHFYCPPSFRRKAEGRFRLSVLPSL